MIGEVMRLLRIIYGINAKVMAERLEISASYLSLIENGKKQPSLDIVKKFASLLNIRLSELLYFSEELSAEYEGNVPHGVITKLTKPLMLKLLKVIAERANHEE